MTTVQIAGTGSRPSLSPARWPWWAAWALLVGSAAAATASLVLHWRVCQGSMLQGSVLRGYAIGEVGFSDACLRRMDSSIPFPYPPEPAEQVAGASGLGGLAMALAALAWAVLVLGLRPRARVAVVAMLPSVVTLGLVGQALLAAGDPYRDPSAHSSLWLLLGVEVAALVALAAIRPRTRSDARLLLPLVVVLWGSTAFGLVHAALDYGGMVLLSEADWDSPPGTGAGTALLLLLSATVAVLTAARRVDRVP